MKSKRAFRPGSLDRLEVRLVLSRVGMGMPAAAEVGGVSAARAGRPAADRMTVQFEVSFLTGMIPHHQMAIRMSQVALRNSADAGVRDLAQRIIAAQRPEIRQMQRFLAVDGVRGFRPTPSSDERAVLGELRSLRGGEFDRAFLSEMIGHHRAAIAGGHSMPGASECLERAGQPGLRRLCSSIVSTQTQEIQEMQMLLGEAGGMPPGHGGMGDHGG